MNLIEIIIVAHILSTFFMTGLIWQIQLNHYPSFKFIDSNQFTEFQNQHMSSISVIVMPMMFVELISGFLITFYPIFNALKLTNLLLIIFVWIVTWFYSIPCHGKLLEEKSIPIIEQLVKTNWLRTIIWTIRSTLIIYMMIQNKVVI